HDTTTFLLCSGGFRRVTPLFCPKFPAFQRALCRVTLHDTTLNSLHFRGGLCRVFLHDTTLILLHSSGFRRVPVGIPWSLERTFSRSLPIPGSVYAFIVYPRSLSDTRLPFA